MKKYFMIFISLMILLWGIVGNSWATSWTFTTAVSDPILYADGAKRYVLTITGLSDGSNPAEFDFSTYMTTSSRAWSIVQGGFLYEVITDPGVELDAVWTLSLDDDSGASLLDLTGLSTTVTERHAGYTDLGYFPTLDSDLQIDIGDIGSSGDTITIYIVILK